MTRNEIAKKLREAADLIDVPGGWGRNEFARTADGRVVNEHDPAAVCFCAYGAISRVSGPGNVYYESRLRNALKNQCDIERGHRLVASRFNDEDAKSAADVSGLMRRAADRLEGMGNPQ